MNLLNEEITHKTFGEGSIVDQDESFVTIDFEEGEKKFIYPDAFRKFITLKDQNTAESMKEIISKMEQEEMEKRQEEKKKQQALEKLRKSQSGSQGRKASIHESSQIVFWLDEDEQENVFNDWQVFTGTVQSGKNKGLPNKPVRLRPNSAGLLTVRDSDKPEEERQIIGLYMVSEMFTGDTNEDGMVPAHEEYRIKLSDQEAEKMLFWNYYINKNYPHRMTWNSGKYRYFDNIWTAQILKDIIVLKTDEEEIKKVESFLEYFCNMNGLDKDNIPEANGALKQ